MGKIFLVFFISLKFSCLLADSEYDPTHLIVKFKSSRSKSAMTQKILQDVKVESYFDQTLSVVEISANFQSSIEDLKSKLETSPDVEYVQFDHVLSERSVDPQFSLQWSLIPQKNNTDISVESVWQNYGGGGRDSYKWPIVVAVVDGGVDIEHEDLQDNLWKNPLEVAGNGIDDDNNGFIDDVYGWNSYEKNGTIPAHDHGTHVAGIVGAVGDNGKGITGVNKRVKIMSIAASSTLTSVVMNGLNYVYVQKKNFLETQGKKGANVVVTNSSFGKDYAKCNDGDFPVWNDMYNRLGSVGILSAAATANLDIDIDEKGDVPTGCNSDYLVAVSNSTVEGVKYSDAGYGQKSIDLMAPGTEIYSTVPGNAYDYKTGTSMSTPHVAGAIALIYSALNDDKITEYYRSPSEFALKVKNALIQSVTKKDAMKAQSVSGGILNVAKALDLLNR